MRHSLFWFLLLLIPCAGIGAAEPPAAKVTAVIASDGQVRLQSGSRGICTLHAGLFEKGWRGASAVGAALAKDDLAGKTRKFTIHASGTATLAGEATFADDGPHGLRAAYTFRPSEDLTLNSLHVSAEFPTAALAGGKWTADAQSGAFPVDYKDTHLFNSPVRDLALELPGGEVLRLAFAAPTPVLLQDDRQWGPTFSVRMGPGNSDGQPFPKGVPVKVAFTLSAKGGLAVVFDRPVVLEADAEWIPLKVELDPVPGSALDFSTLGFQDAPAGKHGWLIARPDGQFAFEQDPTTARRFYGVNLCFSALYLSHELADRLADRLMRLGYNAIRVHHYEGELVSGQANSVSLNKEKLDLLDYLLAACLKRGLYVTTDLFVSRPVKPEELGLPPPGANAKKKRAEFKVLVPVNEKAWENWKAFSRALLTHVNPYTGRSYAQEPGLPLISLINEGNLGNYWGDIQELPEWGAAWNRWLSRQYHDRAALAAAWGAELKAGEDTAKGTVALPGDLRAATPRGRDTAVFLAATERDLFLRAREFLRKELGAKALLTNMNGWTNRVTDQLARREFDYVDDHFYVDHPQFLEQPWRLPSRCPNSSPAAEGAPGGRGVSFTRLLDKPFTLTEYNYAAPGRYRGVGGILTGALGALQGWGGIWRFAYSHAREAVSQPGKLDYFDMACDPLGQAAERASLCLFLRGDLRSAPHSLAVALTPQDLTQPPAKVPGVAPGWTWAAWVTRVGTRVVADPAAALPYSAVLPAVWATPASAYAQPYVAAGVAPYAADSAAIVGLLKARGILGAGNPNDPGKKVLQSETGELTIDGPRDTLLLDTPRTAGGFAPALQQFRTASGGLEVAIQGVDATVWVSALDGQPLARSRRLLVTHLTDLQDTGIQYAEQARQTLLDWGRLPHLVRAGQATVRVRLQDAPRFKVWALSTSGRRLAEVPVQVQGGFVQFKADVAGAAPGQGAVLCYEVGER